MSYFSTRANSIRLMLEPSSSNASSILTPFMEQGMVNFPES
ncbi:hypothetical protein A2U01_0066352, partial [Trifolium medium]|nr:hypothetical protein [Trifolium medium]